MVNVIEDALDLEHRILERIADRVRDLRVIRIDGRFILEGRTTSFHAKQLATHAALEFAPAVDLVNAIQVSPKNCDCHLSPIRRY